MNVKKYYKDLKAQTDTVFIASIENSDLIGSVHDTLICLNDWKRVINNQSTSKILLNVIEQIDLSCLLSLNGLYRQSFSTLRLALEMVSASIYFSAFNLEYNEWQKGGYDIRWAVIMDSESGILSSRFAKAYFPELISVCGDELNETKSFYRELSEMVHGNFSTWDFEEPNIQLKSQSIEKYATSIKNFNKIVNLIHCVRYLNNLSQPEIETLESHIMDSFSHIDIIRTKIGGPV